MRMYRLYGYTEVIFYMIKNLFDRVKFILKIFAFSFAFRMQFLFRIILRTTR